ncbi:three component ABC system middle component [Sphingobacterium sp. BS-2]|uniref:three component ABC system middle component n=1 Tax=Sphingobacterium sp. BS-2 TaxID=3377129 RepID=UPI0038FD3E12
MKSKSIDILASTNPAFCSLLLYSFTEGYMQEANSACPASLLLFPIPLILSNSIKETMHGTNIKTGLFSWVNNNPSITLSLNEKINDSSEYFADAFKYGVLKGILQPVGNSQLAINPTNININYSADKYLKNHFSLAKRLGQWFGQVGSTETIFNFFRITI